MCPTAHETHDGHVHLLSAHYDSAEQTSPFVNPHSALP